MLLASVEDLSKKLTDPPAPDTQDYARAEAALEDASGFAMLQANQPTWTAENVPGVVKSVVVNSALRVYLNPEGVKSRSMGPFSESLPDPSFFNEYELWVLEKCGAGSTADTLQTVNIDNPVIRDGYNQAGYYIRFPQHSSDYMMPYLSQDDVDAYTNWNDYD
jgi:hypothetical protein